ncbi:MAG: DUF255 domain-containing protein, partial [Planctomycetes bacterium]|nr:DUF255 domain-containing protein [Planctomycetota bacterium]
MHSFSLSITLCLGIFAAVIFAGCSSAVSPEAADAAEKSKTAAAKSKKYPANKLAGETSPYLLHHAHNPVRWYPWGPEAFRKAKKEQKPIFLSIGYSSCYWCHVMERLVFMNEEIAKTMNKYFVCIKVDREERPDIDDIYMTSLTVYFRLIGSPQGGGWPLSMFLTSEGKPFVGGTYFPPKDAQGRIGFATVLARVHDLWKNHRKEIKANAELITRQVQQQMKPRPVLIPIKIERKLVSDVALALTDSFDNVYGGIDYRPGARNPSKFPVPAKLALLQYEADRTGNQKAAQVLYYTLDRIAAGGIHDHLAGGFHRYSTDRYWHVPHFEKMLYDQAQLADVYAEAYRKTGKPAYREAVEGILRFVLKDLTDPEGGFYSALDAETDGVEGKHYVWSSAGVEKILGKNDAKLFKQVYGFHVPKRFEHGYVLHLPKSLAQISADTKIPLAELKRRLTAMRLKLLAVRRGRKPLQRDDKVLTSWNGLMIRAAANAGRILKRKDYVQAAEKAATFILSKMRDDKKRLYRTSRGGKAKLNAYLDDYAFLVDGLLALHRATKEQKWLNAARRLTDDQIRDFWSKEAKAFFFTPHHHEQLIARTRNAYDSVIPSGNSVSVRNLLRLAKLTGEKKYRTYAAETLSVFVAAISTMPTGMAQMALAVAEYLDGPPAGPVKDKNGAKEKTRSERPGAVSRHGERGNILLAAAESPAPKKKRKAIVTAKAYLSLDKLPSGGKCEVVLILQIADGWHVNANRVGSKSAIPTVFTLKSKIGAKLIGLKYPPGKMQKTVGDDAIQSVYEKTVEIRGTIVLPRISKAAVDEIEFRVRFQACSNDRCL